MKVRSLVRLAAALGVVIPCGLAAAPTGAGACINATQREDPAVAAVAGAENLLRGGKFADAADRVLTVYPDLKSSYVAGNPLGGRAQRILALAVIRTEGLLSAGEAVKASTASERRANLEWATKLLREINDSNKNVPAVEAELGEALSKLPETQSEALGVLDRLAKKDLLPSAHGWAALAKLRRAAGDQAGSEAAQKRAEELSRSPKTGADAPEPAMAPAGVPKSQPRSITSDALLNGRS